MVKQLFEGSIVIADPSYFVKTDEDWQKCEWGKRLDLLGFSNFLYFEYDGDPQDVVDVKTRRLYGSFCQDSATMAVVLLDELMHYNLDYERSFGDKCNRAIIEEFNGVVIVEDTESIQEDESIQDCIIRGIGNKCFESMLSMD